MMASSSSSCSGNKVPLKLLVDTTNGKVLFPEAGKEFIDFLCHLMLLPVGTIIRLLKKTGMVGSLGTLYNSIENLNDTYMQSSSNKSMILQPKTPPSGLVSPLLLLKDSDPNSAPKTYYRCGGTSSGNCRLYVSDQTNAVCPHCRNPMTSPAMYVEPPELVVNTETAEEGGYVKGVITYMVMDDLKVQPMSAISCLTLISSFHVKDVGALEEKVIEFGMDEGIKLLKASLQSKTVLTDVFLQKK